METCRKYNLSAALLSKWKQRYLAKGTEGLKPAYKRIDPEIRALEEGLKPGLPQNEAKSGGNLFEALYSDVDRLKEFVHAMSGIQMGVLWHFRPSSAAIAYK